MSNGVDSVSAAHASEAVGSFDEPKSENDQPTVLPAETGPVLKQTAHDQQPLDETMTKVSKDNEQAQITDESVPISHREKPARPKTDMSQPRGAISAEERVELEPLPAEATVQTDSSKPLGSPPHSPQVKTNSKALEKLAALLSSSDAPKRICVMVGAGISTSAGYASFSFQSINILSPTHCLFIVMLIRRSPAFLTFDLPTLGTSTSF